MKIRKVESNDINDLKKFKKYINDFKIITVDIITQKEAEMISRMTIGYTFAIDNDDNNMLPLYINILF